MSHERRLLIEKIQVYSAAALCIFLMYAVLWPTLRPAGVTRVAAFLAEGAVGGLLGVIVAYWVFCGVAAIFTAFTRPQGAMMAALAGLAAAGMHSEPTRLLINRSDQSLGALGAAMMVEVVLLAAAVWLGMAIVRVIWLRLVTLEIPPERLGAPSRRWLWMGRITPVDEKPLSASGVWLDFAKAAGATAVLAGVLVHLMLNVAVDPQRGQVIFTIFAAFWIASLAVSWSDFFRGSDLAVLASTVLVAAVVIVMTMAHEAHPPLTWLTLKSWAMALPVDWVAAGGCGAIAGRWLALRLIESGRVARRAQLSAVGPASYFLDPQLITEVFRDSADEPAAKANQKK